VGVLCGDLVLQPYFVILPAPASPGGLSRVAQAQVSGVEGKNLFLRWEIGSKRRDSSLPLVAQNDTPDDMRL